MTMEFHIHSPSPMDVHQLEQLGFSPEHIAGLERVKASYRQEVTREAALEYNRLAFIRWLYLHDRLHS